MSSITQAAATLEDLYREEGKAELITGRIVPLMPSLNFHGTRQANITLALTCETQGFSKGAVTAARTDPAFFVAANHDRDFKKPGKRRHGPPNGLLKAACFSLGVT